MGNFNLFELFQKFNQFKTLLNQTNQDPKILLENELKKRNISPEQLQQMINQAKDLSNLLGLK